MANYFLDEMSAILDEDKKITNKALAEKVSNKIDDAKFFQKLKVSSSFDAMNLDWSTMPTVQSGGQYDIKFTAEPTDSNLHPGVIICALGLRYQSYSSMIARTYLVDPNKSQGSNYKLLLQMHETVLRTIKDGITAKEVYNKALGVLRAKKPELEKHFPKNVGYGIGIESRDGTLIINGKSNRTLKDGMTLMITMGFAFGAASSSSLKKKDTDSGSEGASLVKTAVSPVVTRTVSVMANA